METPKRKCANIIFADPKYNYSTSINGCVSDEDIKKYFKGQLFNMGQADNDNMQICIDCTVEAATI